MSEKGNFKHVEIPKKHPFLLDTCLVCPYCGGENLHIIEVQVHRDEDIITITDREIHVDRLENEGRGTYVNIKYDCESGHRGRMILHFYKGNTFIFNEEMPNVTELAKARGDFCIDIFRD